MTIEISSARMTLYASYKNILPSYFHSQLCEADEWLTVLSAVTDVTGLNVYSIQRHCSVAVNRCKVRPRKLHFTLAWVTFPALVKGQESGAPETAKCLLVSPLLKEHIAMPRRTLEV